jgi:hypothetical protein
MEDKEQLCDWMDIKDFEVACWGPRLSKSNLCVSYKSFSVFNPFRLTSLMNIFSRPYGHNGELDRSQ